MKKILSILGAVGLVASTSGVATACNTKNNNNNEKTEMTLDEMVMKFNEQSKLLEGIVITLDNQDKVIKIITLAELGYKIYLIDKTKIDLLSDSTVEIFKTKLELCEWLENMKKGLSDRLAAETLNYINNKIKVYSN